MWLCFSESLAWGLHWAVQRASGPPSPNPPPQLPAAEALICPIFSSSCGEMVWCHTCRLSTVHGTMGFCYFFCQCVVLLFQTQPVLALNSAHTRQRTESWPSDFCVRSIDSVCQQADSNSLWMALSSTSIWWSLLKCRCCSTRQLRRSLFYPCIFWIIAMFSFFPL